MRRLRIERERERGEGERDISLPLLLSLLSSFVRVLRRSRTRDRLDPFASEEESLSLSIRGLKINDNESLVRPIDPDPSTGWCLIDDSVTHLASFPGSRAATVLPSPYHFGIRRIDSTLVQRLLRCLDVNTAEAMRRWRIVRGCTSVFGYTRAHVASCHRGGLHFWTSSNEYSAGNFLDIVFPLERASQEVAVINRN